MAEPKLALVPERLPFLLGIVTIERGTTATIEFEGEWDLTERDAASDAVSQALWGRPEYLVLDLSRLSFIDSTGVHALVETHKRCKEQGTRLAIVPGPPPVQRPFEVCGLTGILPFTAPLSSLPDHPSPTPTGDPGGCSLHPQRRRRSLA